MGLSPVQSPLSRFHVDWEAQVSGGRGARYPESFFDSAVQQDRDPLGLALSTSGFM